MYVDYGYYVNLYGEQMQEPDFSRFVWDACHRVDRATTGVDGVKKLKTAFPTEEDAAEAVKRCVCSLVFFQYSITAAEKSALRNRGYVETADGLRGKVITSVSAGNESVTYSAGSSGVTTSIDKALTDRDLREQMYQDIIQDYLSGVTDANGVNLLYMGPYPV